MNADIFCEKYYDLPGVGWKLEGRIKWFAGRLVSEEILDFRLDTSLQSAIANLQSVNFVNCTNGNKAPHLHQAVFYLL
jgi:hypothetical protein